MNNNFLPNPCCNIPREVVPSVNEREMSLKLKCCFISAMAKYNPSYFTLPKTGNYELRKFN